MVRLNTLTLEWMMGIFCTALGALMLIAPHQYASPIYVNVQPWLPYWGCALLAAGGALLLAAGVSVRRSLVVAALLFAAAVLGALAAAFASFNGIEGLGIYGTLVVALLIAVVASNNTFQPDLFALMIAANNLLTGLFTFGATTQQSPIFIALGFPVTWLGTAFIISGGALIVAHCLPFRSAALLWATHSIGALPMLLFLGLIAIPLRLWPAMLYYGGFGTALLVLPWLGPRLLRIVIGSLRARLALASTALAVLPLVATLAIVTNSDEQLAADQALTQQHFLAVSIASTISGERQLNTNPSVDLQRILAAQAIEPNTRIVVIDSSDRVLAEVQHVALANTIEHKLPTFALLAHSPDNGELRYNAADGTWLAGSAPVDSRGWLVVVTRPVLAALGIVHNGRESVFILLGIVGTLAAAAGVLMARWLTKPLRDLTNAVQALAESNSTPQLPQIQVAEIAQLAMTFGVMRERLQARTVERDWADTQRMQLLQQEHAARLAAEQAVERTLRLQTVTAALAQSLTSAQIAQAVTDEAVAALGAVAGLVALCTPDRTMLEVVSSVGYPQEASQGWEQFPVATEVPLSAVIRTCAPVYIESADERNLRFPGLPSVQGEMGSVAAVALPLVINGQAIGALGFSLLDYRPISADERTFMETMARLCAQALDRAQLFEAEHTARAEAEAAVQVRETFLSIASHELKTPLTSLYGHAELLERRTRDEGILDSRTRRSVLVILDQSRRLNRLIGTLLDVSRIRAGKLDLAYELVDLGGLVAQVTTEIAPLLTNHSLHFTPPTALITVAGDPLRLEQVIYNLLNNAIKYSPIGGAIEVDLLVTPQQQAILTVRDQGIGIPVAALPNLFTPFYRAENVDGGKISGMGIGLHVVREIVSAHGGTISVESVEGGGSTFTVLLPLHVASAVMYAPNGEIVTQR